LIKRNGKKTFHLVVLDILGIYSATLHGVTSPKSSLKFSTISCVLATVLFIVNLHQVSSKMPTDSTGVSASDVAEAAVIQPLLHFKSPKPFDFTKHEEWPRWFDLNTFNAENNANNNNVKNQQ